MDNNEIVGRLLVLETFVMGALGLFLANSKNDPDYSKAGAVLEHLRAAAISNASFANASAQTVAQSYANHLASLLASNLPNLRGEGGLSH